MSKLSQGSIYNFFQPNVAALNTVVDIGAASADLGEFICIRPCRMLRTMFTLTDELAGGTTTAPTVIFKKRPTPKSATGELTSSTLTIPDATAVGKTVYEDTESETTNELHFEVGDSLEISHTVGVGTPTGQGVASALFEEDPDVPGNMTDMIATA